MALIAGDRRLTYAGLDARANRFARALIDAGVAPGEHVAILSWNRAEWIEAFFGCFKARAVPVNLNYRYTATELRHVLSDSDAVGVVYEGGFDGVLDEVLPSVPGVRVRLRMGDEYEAALGGASASRLEIARSGDDRYILYTGGTTGMPKGVEWRHEDLFFAALGGNTVADRPLAEPADLGDAVRSVETVAYVLAPLMHGAAQWSCCHTSLGWYSGGTVMISTLHGLDASAVWEDVGRERVTMLTVVGDAVARPLLDALKSSVGRYDTTSLVSLGSGGAILSPGVKDELRTLLPGIVLVDAYGASETGASASSVERGGREMSRFLPNEEVAVLGDDLRPLPPGSPVIGRLARRGHIPLGYYNDPEKTAATFPLIDGERWCIPGDFATVQSDGTVILLGRGSACINTGGEKVFPDEVEAVLKEHPAVFDAVVVGVPDERFTERVAAIIQVREGWEAPSLESLQVHCGNQLAGYKAPRQVVVVEQIPRTAVGKPDYRLAKSVALAGKGNPAAGAQA
jgi:fatty-acyl-CoA synthase